MIRSALPGPRSTRASPAATVAITIAAQASRNSSIDDFRIRDNRIREPRLFGRQLFRDWLADIEAVVDDSAISQAARNRAWQQARVGGKRIARRAGRRLR